MRVLRCFGFVDLSGFTALTDREGDEEAVAILGHFRSWLRTIASRRGVRIAKWLGDGAMMVSVDTSGLLEAVLELHFVTPRFSDEVVARAGITAGEVILYEGDDYIGHPVNKAARLCDAASGGEVLAEPELADRLPRWGAVLATEELTLRGIARPVAAAHLGLRALRPPTVADPVCGISLNRQVAAATAHDATGQEHLFCSASCFDTWERRPAPPPEDVGSLRSPLIGS